MKYLIIALKFLLVFAVLLTIGLVLLFGHRDIPINDLKLKYTNSGKSVCNLSIANNRVYTSNGEKVTDPKCEFVLTEGAEIVLKVGKRRYLKLNG